MRNRPDSGSTPRRAAPDAHGTAGSNCAAAAVTISGLGNRRPNASIARSSSVAVPSRTDSRTFSAHITSPPAAAGLRQGTSVDVRPTAGALPPCGLAASGVRDLPSTDVPAEPGPRGGPSGADEPSADGVETVAEESMLGIGMPAPRSRRVRSQRKRRHDSPWSGAQAPCPVYVRSSDRLNTSAQLNAAHMTHRIR
ncbi:hypothetical protein MycrhDRAFT_0416 [Mycolicibacterium rhodesiae JS60]|nr:hypothetical protein MycrhDRAFT_0416 [Mycolicibacterium rhodesiae JS60]